MEEINNKIFPLLNELHWDKYQIYLTTLNNLKLYNKTPLSITTLYQIFEKTNELFYIERLKGLGSMKPNEAKITCLDKDTRITYPIKSVGDIDLIYNLLGDSPNTRKELLNSLNLIVAS
jgi:DNA gyrase/topoisomerase IV subunit B